MSRDAEKDILTGPETEQLLSADTHGDTPHRHMSLQPDERRSTETLSLQDDVSSSRLTSQNDSMGLSCGAQVGATSNNSTAVVSSSSIVVNGEDNDDPPPYSAIPPPYSAIALPNHVGLPYELFSFGDSTDRANCRMEIPLTPFQASVMPITGFHHEGINDQHAFPMSLTSHRFFKFGWRRSSFVSREMSFPDNEISEKIDDRRPRRYSAILVAAAVIIFLMLLSLMVRFVMEKSWWRR